MVSTKPSAKRSVPAVDGGVELLPGDLSLGTSGVQFRTLLGSCVSVILTDPNHTIGAMNHIVHVGTPNAANIENTAYASVSMRHMFSEIQALGYNPRMCKAYVYGGGNMFPHLFQTQHVGSSNAAWVLQFLQNEGIKVVDQDTGGSVYRIVSWTVGVEAPMVETVSIDKGLAHVR